MSETSQENSITIAVTVTAARSHYNSPIRANATVTLGGCFVIHGVRVLKGEGGLFVSMPARQGNDGIFRDTAHPISRPFARRLNAAVLSAYQAFLGRQMEESRDLPHVTEPDDGCLPDGGARSEV